MKVLLCEDIERLGWLGDVVEVKDGYARNYLLPQGRAKTASEVNIKAISDEKQKRAEQRKTERVRVEETANTVEGAEAVVAAKANEQGHLFGSVTGAAIAENLRAQGFEVADEVVQISTARNTERVEGERGITAGERSLPAFKAAERIKRVGTYSVTLRFAEDLTCQVNVVVVAEQDGVVEADES